MGRKPKPTELRLLQGNPGKRKPQPGREPKPAASRPKPPPWLKGKDQKEARKVWQELLPQLEAMGVVTAADGPALALLCQVHVEHQRQQTAALAARVQALMAEFGLTPSARSRIRLPEAPGEDPYAAWKAKRRGGKKAKSSA